MMLSLKIALRYLRSKKAHSAVNIISIVSVCGVIVASAAIICVLSVFNGFGQLINSKLSTLDPDIAITATLGKAMPNGDSIANIATTVPGVELAMPTVEEHGLAMFYNYQMPLRIKGVPTDYHKINNIKDAIIDGEFCLDDGISKYTVLGVGPAINLNARPDMLMMVNLYAPKRKGKINLANPTSAFRADSLFTAGVFQIDQAKYDRDLIFVPIETARKLFDYTTEATSVELRLLPNANENTVADALKQRLGNNYSVKTRLQQQDEAFRLVNIEKWVSFLLLSFILIIATFNVIGALSLLIIEKKNSIATFRYIGASDKQIQKIFITEGWLISLTGAIIGITIGLILCLLQQHFGLIKMQGNTAQLIIDAYPVAVEFTDILIVLALIAAIGTFTSIITAIITRRILK